MVPPDAKPARGRRAGRADASPPSLPPGTPDWVTLDLVRETVRVWQPYYAGRISVEDAVTILAHAGRLFGVLSEK